MLPVLLNFKFIKIYTFGVFLVLAFFWGCFLLWQNIRLTSYKEEDIFDGLFLSLAGGLFFGRLAYILFNFKDFGFNLLKFILINGYPGISMYGALFGIFLTLYLFIKSKKISFLELVDYFIAPLFISLVFIKLGSFFAGVEVGTKTSFLLKIRYFGFDGYRHLTPFYEALLFIIGAFLSRKLLMEIRKEKYFKGFLIYFFSWYFSLVYFLFDKIKFNRLYFLGFSVNRIVSLIILLTLTFYFIYYFKSGILIFIKAYGQKIVEKINSRTKRKVRERKEKKPPAD
jgi:phosphatidylglycerol:prolipoprotein diacylglycerol transferase